MPAKRFKQIRFFQKNVAKFLLIPLVSYYRKIFQEPHEIQVLFLSMSLNQTTKALMLKPIIPAYRRACWLVIFVVPSRD